MPSTPEPSIPSPPSEIIIAPGRPLPLGATVLTKAINFALFCRQASRVTLLLFKADEKRASYTFSLTPPLHRTGDIWHIELRGLPLDYTYAYQLHTPGEANSDQEPLVLDPYAKVITGGETWGQPAHDAWRCGIVDGAFDWQGDLPLNRPLADTIIYELHVRGFTRHPSARVKHPGTFLGLIEKIPYLTELGVTALELLPTAEFDENEVKAVDQSTGQPLKNYWGYNPLAYFAPKASFAATRGQQVNEFKTMVRALHQAGIEVILDVVFNHTGEGNHQGPTISFKALGNSIYYLLDEAKDDDYHNFSGCGNTVNCNHPVVREFIIDCLRYWVLTMHVDGFRFDLASIMTRGPMGEVMSHPPLVEQIAEDPVLAQTKIIAEAWDAAGLYQVGHFSNNPRWVEWNGRYRDDCRAFLAGNSGNVSKFATRIAGSSDLYQHNHRRPTNSINFLTSHDGFTLWDLVSYNHKHNEQNGEHNQDGENHNLSWNSGKEGESRSPKIRSLRARRVRTMAVVLMLSQGTPMLVAGDEFGRTQEGNNNAYCQDNAISWLDWRLLERNADLLRFFRMLIRLRLRYQLFRRTDFFPPPQSHRPPEIVWQGAVLGREEWSPACKLLCFTLIGKAAGQEPDFFVIINSGLHETTVAIPPPTNGGRWRRIIDTALPSPEDIVEEGAGPLLHGSTITAAAMAAVVLIAKRGEAS